MFFLKKVHIHIQVVKLKLIVYELRFYNFSEKSNTNFVMTSTTMIS